MKQSFRLSTLNGMPAISDEASMYFLGLLFAADVTISRATDRAANYIDTNWALGRGLAHWLLDIAESNLRRLIVVFLWWLILLCWIIEPMYLGSSAWIQHTFAAREAEKRKAQQVVCKIAETKVKGERPFVSATIEGYPGRSVEFHWASEPSLSLIGKELYEDMKKTNPAFDIVAASISLQTHTNKPVPCLGRVELELNFEVPGTDCTQRLPASPFYVIDSKDTVPIIGSHLFLQYRSGLQYTRDSERRMTLIDKESDSASLPEGRTDHEIAAIKGVPPTMNTHEQAREPETKVQDEHGVCAVQTHDNATQQGPTLRESDTNPRTQAKIGSPVTSPLAEERLYAMEDLLVSEEIGEPELAGVKLSEDLGLSNEHAYPIELYTDKRQPWYADTNARICDRNIEVSPQVLGTLMSQMLQKCPNLVHYQDDLLVISPNQQALYASSQQVLNTLVAAFFVSLGCNLNRWLISNRGKPPFRSDRLVELWKSYSFNAKCVLAYNSASNELVKRTNQLLLRQTMALRCDLKMTWGHTIKRVTHYLRIPWNREEFSPFETMHPASSPIDAPSPFLPPGDGGQEQLNRIYQELEALCDALPKDNDVVKENEPVQNQARNEARFVSPAADDKPDDESGSSSHASMEGTAAPARSPSPAMVHRSTRVRKTPERYVP